MSEGVLTILKFCLLALLYLFLARVVWIVARELRGAPAPVAPVAPAAATPKREKRRPWLVRVAGADGNLEHWIDGEATIGRGGGCTISVPADTFVSQVHARLIDRDGTLWVEDLGSTNGTFLNGKQVAQPTKMRKGDRVQVGETVLQADR